MIPKFCSLDQLIILGVPLYCLCLVLIVVSLVTNAWVISCLPHPLGNPYPLVGSSTLEPWKLEPKIHDFSLEEHFENPYFQNHISSTPKHPSLHLKCFDKSIKISKTPLRSYIHIPQKYVLLQCKYLELKFIPFISFSAINCKPHFCGV